MVAIARKGLAQLGYHRGRYARYSCSAEIHANLIRLFVSQAVYRVILSGARLRVVEESLAYEAGEGKISPLRSK